MPNLDESIRADLDRLRTFAAPDGAAKDRMWAALGGQLGPGPDDGGLDEGGGDSGGDGGLLDGGGTGAELGATSGASQLGFAAKVIGVTIGLTGAGLLSLRLAALGVHALSHPSSPPPDTAAQVLAPTRAEELGASDATTQDPAPPSDTGEPTPIVQAPTRPSSRPSSMSGPETPPGPDTGADTLTAELALIERARAGGSSDETLALLDRHRDQFPDGQLGEERELLRIEALCALDRLEAAREAATALRARGRVPAARVREICPALSE